MRKYIVSYYVEDEECKSTTVDLPRCLNWMIENYKYRNLEITEIKEVVWDD